VTWLGFSDQVSNEEKREAGSPEAGMATPAPELFSLCESVMAIQQPAGFSKVNILRSAFGPSPVIVLKYTTNEMANTLRSLLERQEFDIVQVESQVLAAYLPIIRAAVCRPRIICDWHNLESEVLERYSANTPNVIRRLYTRRTAHQMLSFERSLLLEVESHLAVSERDRDQLLALCPEARVFVVENGVDVEQYSEPEIAQAWNGWRTAAGTAGAWQEPPARNRILFVGSMDYHANVDAAVKFAYDTWPKVHARRPDLVFTIVGRRPRPEVRELASLPGIEVTGTVEDVRPYYHEAAACVVPLRIGGGSRLKILEAMAAGVPVVSTPLGAEGLAIASGKHLLLAETSDQISRTLIELLEDAEFQQRLCAAGRRLVEQRYDWSVIGNSLESAYQQLLSQQHAAALSVATQ
jgi:glycosyltransferase involved in cell wall biosynthesis